MALALCILFFISGASALLFETLWFRAAGLAFGNGIWASSLVLSSFMAGLGLGNALVAGRGERLRHPVRIYAGAELLIAITGLTLVMLLPGLGTWLAPLLRPFLDVPWILNPLRFAIAFTLLLVPSLAMGATLPILVATLSVRGASFGRTLGMLYGWNTLGAVVGALLGEAYTIPRLGIRGSGVAAAALNLGAALGAAALARRPDVVPREGAAGDAAVRPLDDEPPALRPRRVVRLLAAAFLAGGLLLALEVVWFRFLLLFVHGSSLAFALMLAVVLAGIGTGGLAASAAVRAGFDPARRIAALACTSAVLCVASYAAFSHVLAPFEGRSVNEPSGILRLGLCLMFPVSFVSGLLFPSIGTALRAEIRSPTRAAGALTLFNTGGAALGSLLAGFLLLPLLGMERSLFLLAAGYGGVALCAGRGSPGTATVRSTAPAWAGAVAVAVALAAFPFGRMREVYLQLPLRRFATQDETRVAAVREGLTETLVYTEIRRFGGIYYHQLLTNGFSMSGDHWASRRYMKLFVYLPVALHPGPRSALLISYGVGSTAKALTDTRELETIDVVDISREILELSGVVFPDPAEHPLHDPRVTVHVEDGRWFLQTTDRHFDLITAEPPPPKLAGVVSLYTREHFALLYDRLNEGGIVSYWLPVHGLSESDTRAIVRAFCDVFADCSLWHGTAWNLILVGTRNAGGPVSPERFVRQWSDPTVGDELRALGIERPEQLGALFVGDADYLREISATTLPLTDDFPKRLSDAAPPTGAAAPMLYRAWLDAAQARARFRHSALVERLWPEPYRDASLPYFSWQQVVNDVIAGPGSTRSAPLASLHRVLTQTSLRTLPLWILGSDPFEQRLVDRARASGVPEAELARPLAARALADRDYAEAARLFDLARQRSSDDRMLALSQAYALCMARRGDDGRQILAQALQAEAGPHSALAWLDRICAAATAR